MIDYPPENLPKAYLIGAYFHPKDKELAVENLKELQRLGETLGVKVVGWMLCFIRKKEAATYFTKGKVEEIAIEAEAKEADLILVDEEIAPSQQRNLENQFKRRVMDRTELILEVFASHARTKEAKLQIELAKTRYLAPRLKRMWTHLSRQQGSAGGGSGGGGGYLKGEGEKQIEIDRRILKRNIDELQKEINQIAETRALQRSAREKSKVPTFAIIGYTNAGKSTLMNSMTAAGVLVEDKLFATLDTTTRKFSLPNKQEVLLIDTVGFIRNLPHLLVAAFKSTLEEALFADILLHLVDVSHPYAVEQAATTHEVLKELKAEKRPIITVLNKVDLAKDRGLIQKLKILYPYTVEISALTGQGIPELVDMMEQELKKQKGIFQFKVPQEKYQIVTELIEAGQVLQKEYEGNDVLLTVELARDWAPKWKKYEFK
jgi:GTP-binding protein HflX